MITMKIFLPSLGAAIVAGIIGAVLYFSGNGNIIALFDALVVALALALLPSGVYDYLKVRRIREIEDRLPDFLRDVAEASRFGMTLADAITSASKGRYGILTNEIRKMAYQIQWGVPVGVALESFLSRASTPLTKRIVSTIIKSNEAGGNVSDVLNMVADYSREVQQLTKEKYSQLSSYTVVLLIAYGVFLVTILILNVQFFPQMIKAGLGATGTTSNNIASINVSIIPTVKIIFAGAIIVHAIGDGLMAGVLKDGRFESGFITATALVVGGYLFLLLLGGV
ncbi:MAG: type II secretion system F family protein [Candidatus Thermoplasmatota archaeon]|jgi:flagellar protein FlaJ|nr:type II secretion system F family protein [Candidatus Thermoplasmatota archaeon]